MTPSAEPKHISLSEIVARHGEPPWAEALFTDGRNNAVLICNAPGQENDAHAHPDFNEWWVVLQGELLWEIGDYAPVRAKKGDVVMAAKGRRHAIRTVGSENSLRLGVTHPESNHDSKGARSNILRPMPQDDVPNRLHTSLEYMLEKFGDPPWRMSDTPPASKIPGPLKKVASQQTPHNFQKITEIHFSAQCLLGDI